MLSAPTSIGTNRWVFPPLFSSRTVAHPPSRVSCLNRSSSSSLFFPLSLSPVSSAPSHHPLNPKARAMADSDRTRRDTEVKLPRPTRVKNKTSGPDPDPDHRGAEPPGGPRASGGGNPAPEAEDHLSHPARQLPPPEAQGVRGPHPPRPMERQRLGSSTPSGRSLRRTSTGRARSGSALSRSITATARCG